MYDVDGMGHYWPGGVGPFGDDGSGLVASPVIWEFLAAHARTS